MEKFAIGTRVRRTKSYNPTSFGMIYPGDTGIVMNYERVSDVPGYNVQFDRLPNIPIWNAASMLEPVSKEDVPAPSQTQDEPGGCKSDTGKERWDLLPWGGVEEIVKLYTFGVKKYDDWNWYKGIKYNRLVAAMCRHMIKRIWYGEQIDPESGCHHMAAVAFYCLAIMTFDFEGRTDLDNLVYRKVPNVPNNEQSK